MPHVTCRRDIRHVIKPVPVDTVIWQASRFALVESVAGQYHVVSHWPLKMEPAKRTASAQQELWENDHR